MLDSLYLGSSALAPRRSEQEPRESQLATSALECARGIVWAPGTKASRHFPRRVKEMGERMRAVFALAAQTRAAETEQHRWLRENSDLLRSQLAQLREMGDAELRPSHVLRFEHACFFIRKHH